MKLALFGASGATGLLLTERALAAGHNVTALLRKPETFPFRDRVHVVEGNAFNPGAIEATLAGADAVLSALGARSLRREDVLERAMPLIVAAMQRSGPRRLIALGSAGALPDSMKFQPAWQQWLVKNILYKTLLKYPVASQVAQYRILSASTLDWTMALPPMLVNAPAHGTYRIDPNALPPGASRIARADVADFLMSQLTDTTYVRRGVYLSW